MTKETFQMRKPVADLRAGEINSGLICAEKPDVAQVEKLLLEITEVAPEEIQAILQRMYALRLTVDRQQFESQLQSLKEELEANLACAAWTPAIISPLQPLHLFAKDGMDSPASLPWQKLFIQQVHDIRFCHLRHIAKKGKDLDGTKHFDAHFKPPDDPHTIERIAAAQEVLDPQLIAAQAHKLLMQAQPVGDKLTFHMLRPMKDYKNTETSYNVLTVVYARMLHLALEAEAKVQFPGVEMNIKDTTAMMVTHNDRTNATAFERLVHQPLFALPGHLQNENVIIVDDHVNGGGFLMTLSAQLHDAKANIMGIATFSRHAHAATLEIDPAITEALCEVTRVDKKEWNLLLAPFGLSLDTLTSREALTFLALVMDSDNPDHVIQFNYFDAKLSGNIRTVAGKDDDLHAVLSKPPLTVEDIRQDMEKMLEGRGMGR